MQAVGLHGVLADRCCVLPAAAARGRAAGQGVYFEAPVLAQGGLEPTTDLADCHRVSLRPPITVYDRLQFANLQAAFCSAIHSY